MCKLLDITVDFGEIRRLLHYRIDLSELLALSKLAKFLEMINKLTAHLMEKDGRRLYTIEPWTSQNIL